MRRLLLSAALLALAATSLAAPAVAGDDPTARDVAPGDCFDLTWKQVNGTRLPDEVPCRDRHTTQVTAVPDLPDDVSWDDEDAVLDAVGPVCVKATMRAIGRNDLRIARSTYDWAWFGPTDAQRDAGARWFSCHLVVRSGNGVATLPTHPPKLGRHIPDSVARCISRQNRYVVCAAPHRYRSSHSFYVRGDYSQRKADTAQARTCPDHVATPRNYRWSSAGAQGNHFVVVCYSHTRR